MMDRALTLVCYTRTGSKQSLVRGHQHLQQHILPEQHVWGAMRRPILFFRRPASGERSAYQSERALPAAALANMIRGMGIASTVEPAAAAQYQPWSPRHVTSTLIAGSTWHSWHPWRSLWSQFSAAPTLGHQLVHSPNPIPPLAKK